MIATPRARILVVDDEVLNRRLIQAILGPEGHDLVQAATGEQALELIAIGDIDLVLLDVVMPGLDGIEVCRRVREELGQPLLPIIIISALADPSSRTRGKQVGADDFLTKPIHEDELLARVHTLLVLRRYHVLAETQRVQAELAARRWKLVSDVAAAVAGCRDYGSLTAAIFQRLQGVLDVDVAAFFEVVDGGLLRVSVAPSAGSGQPVVASPWERQRRAAVEGTQPIRISRGDLDAAPFEQLMVEHQLCDGVALPVVVGGALQGVFYVGRTTPFVARELALFDDLISHVTNAIANVRSLIKTALLNEARDRLSLLLVHDLKNPLQVIRSNLEIFDELDGPDRVESVRDSQAAVGQLLAMIVELLDIARAEEGQLALDPRPTMLDELIRNSLAAHGPAMKQGQVRLRYDVAPDLCASIDPDLIRRVIDNLVSNALRYVSRGGDLEVDARVEGDRVLIVVGNDGPVIPDAARARLFEKYATFGTVRTGPNRGLGLYFCRLGIEQHGGTIELIDRPGGGVRFLIRLPYRSPSQARALSL